MGSTRSRPRLKKLVSEIYAKSHRQTVQAWLERVAVKMVGETPFEMMGAAEEGTFKKS